VIGQLSPRSASSPALVGILGLSRISRLRGVLNYELLPALLIFVELMLYDLIRKRRAAAEQAEAR
jgi:Membrane transport protein MerF